MYDQTRNWSYLFYPPPYNFLAPPARLAPGQLVPEDVLQPRGMGCADCGGTCDGLGQASTGLFGTGLFVSADPSTWGWGEYAVLAGGGYLAISLISDAQSAGGAVRKAYRRRRR